MRPGARLAQSDPFIHSEGVLNDGWQLYLQGMHSDAKEVRCKRFLSICNKQKEILQLALCYAV